MSRRRRGYPHHFSSSKVMTSPFIKKSHNSFSHFPKRHKSMLSPDLLEFNLPKRKKRLFKKNPFSPNRTRWDAELLSWKKSPKKNVNKFVKNQTPKASDFQPKFIKDLERHLNMELKKLHNLKKNEGDKSGLEVLEMTHNNSQKNILKRFTSKYETGVKYVEEKKLDFTPTKRVSSPLQKKKLKTKTKKKKKISVSSELEIYRECFIRFINHFQIYEDFLNRILSKYDNYVGHLKNKIQKHKILLSQLQKYKEKSIISLHSIQQNTKKWKEEQSNEVEFERKNNESVVTKANKLEEEIIKLKQQIVVLKSEKQYEVEQASNLADALQFSQDKIISLKKDLIVKENKIKGFADTEKKYNILLKKSYDIKDTVKKDKYEKVVDECQQYRHLSEKLAQQLRRMKRGNERLAQEMINLKLGLDKAQVGMHSSLYVEKAKEKLSDVYTPRPYWNELKKVVPNISIRNSSSEIVSELENYIEKLHKKIDIKEKELNKRDKILQMLKLKQIWRDDNDIRVSKMKEFEARDLKKKAKEKKKSKEIKSLNMNNKENIDRNIHVLDHNVNNIDEDDIDDIDDEDDEGEGETDEEEGETDEEEGEGEGEGETDEEESDEEFDFEELDGNVKIEKDGQVRLMILKRRNLSWEEIGKRMGIDPYTCKRWWERANSDMNAILEKKKQGKVV